MLNCEILSAPDTECYFPELSLSLGAQPLNTPVCALKFHMSVFSFIYCIIVQFFELDFVACSSEWLLNHSLSE